MLACCFYFRFMIPGDDHLIRWQQLLGLTEKRWQEPPLLNKLLLLIGEKECGMPPRNNYTVREQEDLIQMALSTVLVPARYYELFWVEDTGWPHYRQLQRLPPMSDEERENFLKPWIIAYCVKNRWFPEMGAS